MSAHHEARHEIMRVAAELAQRLPLRSLFPLEEVTHIGHRQFRAAFAPADEACRLLAIRLRAALDAMPALAAARGIVSPEGIETGTGSTAQPQEPGPVRDAPSSTAPAPAGTGNTK